MKALFTLFYLIITIGASTAQSSIIQAVDEKWNHQKEYLLECLNLLEEKDLEYKPTEDEMTLRELVMHMGGNAIWLSQEYLGGDKFIAKYDHKDLNKEELTIHMNQVMQFAHTSLQGLEDHDLRMRVDFFAGEKSVLQILELLDDHFSHHKGQLTVYLRLLGKKAPRYVGW